MSRTGRTPEEIAARVKALESMMIEQGLVTAEMIDRYAEVYENEVGPQLGARAVARAAGVAEPRIELRPRPVDDPEVRRPDITRAVTELGWKPEIPLGEGVQRTVPWFRRALEAAGS